MEVISTTNPIPPTGATNTSVPLGITSSVSETPQPINVPVLPTSVFRNSHGIYLGYFTFSDAKDIGASLYSWSYRYPLTDSYKRTENSDGQVSGFTPWDLVLPYFSKECKVDYDMQLVPIKIADCRARIDVIFNYEEATFDQPYSTKLMANENEHFLLDDSDDQLRFCIPSFWMTNNVTTDMSSVKASDGDINIPSAYLPSTQFRFYVAAPYQHNAMQMKEFNVHLILYPKVSNAIGVAGKRAVTTDSVTGTLTTTLTPYFYNFK